MLFRFRCSFKRTKIILFLNLQAFIFIIFVENIFSMKQHYIDEPNFDLQRELFGKRMKQIRLEKNITRKTLQSSTKLTFSHLGRIEQGKQSPTLVTMTKIFKVFGITFDEFFHTEDFQKEIK